MIACLFMLGVLGFASTAFQAEAPVGVPPTKCNQVGSISSAGNPVPNATTNCGQGYLCSDNGQCCGGGICCPSNMNLYCKSQNLCYNTVSGAKAGCGDNYTICWVPAK